MLDSAELSFDEEAGTREMGPPLSWWRRHQAQWIINRRSDLLAEISTATRGLISDETLNPALVGNTSTAILVAEQLSGKATHDLLASWICWAAAAGDALAKHILMERLANEASPRNGQERGQLLELVVEWQRFNRLAPFSTGGVRQSLGGVDTHPVRASERPASLRSAKASASTGEVSGACMKVVSAIGDTGSRDERQLVQRYKSLVEPLPLQGGQTNLEVLRVALLREFPWMWELVEDLFDDLTLRRAAGVPWLHFAPILIVGPPGVGKTRFARRLAQLAGTGYRQINAAGSSDNRMLMGTARGWDGAQPALPLLVVRSSGSANPVIVVDEIDKARSEGRKAAKTYSSKATDSRESARKALLNIGTHTADGKISKKYR